MGVVVHLVPAELSRETVEMLTNALEAARNGDAIGCALVLIHPGHHFTIDFSGAALHHDPAWVRGAIAKLDDHLASL